MEQLKRIQQHLLFIIFMFFTGIPFAQADVSCPDRSVKSNQTGKYAYNLANLGPGTCTNSVAIPNNGIRVYSSWLDCRVGRFIAVGEKGGGGGGVLPSLLTCENCTQITKREGVVAPGTSANFSAYFKLDNDTDVGYRATFTRSEIDSDGNYTCSLSGGVVKGGSFGGDAIRPTATIGNLSESSDSPGTYTANVTLSEPSTDFEVGDLALSKATATLSGAVSDYVVSLTPTEQWVIALSVPKGSFTDAADNPNKSSNSARRCAFDEPRTLVDGINGRITACLAPEDGTSQIQSVDTVLTMTFDQPMYPGNGNITITKVSDDTVVNTINVRTNVVTFFDNTVTVTLEKALEAATEYAVTIQQGALRNGNGNDFLVINDKTVWNFTTALDDQEITFNVPATQSYTSNGTFTISASSDSGLPVTVTSNSPSVCDVSGTTVTMISIGTCELTANQAGDASYQPAKEVSETIKIENSGGGSFNWLFLLLIGLKLCRHCNRKWG